MEMLIHCQVVCFTWRKLRFSGVYNKVVGIR